MNNYSVFKDNLLSNPDQCAIPLLEDFIQMLGNYANKMACSGHKSNDASHEENIKWSDLVCGNANNI